MDSEHRSNKKADQTFFITMDVEKCRGCRICELVCSFSHTSEFNPAKSNIRCIITEEDGVFYGIPMFCQQCKEPVCMNVCPVKAIYIDSKTGAKLVNIRKCIGCRVCMSVCPFGGISFDADRNIMTKCDLCNGDPLCVQYCPFNALEYVRSDKIDVQRKRKGIQAILESQKGSLRESSI
jgi:carbon-monoxide dehydrogenase iron sulfur subunit